MGSNMLSLIMGAKYVQSRLILENYYREMYTEVLYKKSFLNSGISFFHKQVEKYWKDKNLFETQLEVGIGNGEHFKFVENFPTKKYYGIDLILPNINLLQGNVYKSMVNNFQFIQGDSQKLPFEDEYFDRVVTTCVLHHVDSPILALEEIRRVVKKSGEISILLSTDPGLLNNLSRFLVTNRIIKWHTSLSPKLIYALDHKNHTSSLIEMIKFVFDSDELEFHYAPFSFLHSWNFNLSIVAKVCVVK